MSGMGACKCHGERITRQSVKGTSSLVVVDRNCNYSAFNGYRQTWSRYSRLLCLNCAWVWRSCATWVDEVPDITPEIRDKWQKDQIKHDSDQWPGHYRQERV